MSIFYSKENLNYNYSSKYFSLKSTFSNQLKYMAAVADFAQRYIDSCDFNIASE